MFPSSPHNKDRHEYEQKMRNNVIVMVLFAMGACEGVWSTASSFAEEVELPHDLYRPFQVQTFLDDLPEHLLCLMFALLQDESVPDVISVLHTRQLRDTCASHLHDNKTKL